MRASNPPPRTASRRRPARIDPRYEGSFRSGPPSPADAHRSSSTPRSRDGSVPTRVFQGLKHWTPFDYVPGGTIDHPPRSEAGAVSGRCRAPVTPNVPGPTRRTVRFPSAGRTHHRGRPIPLHPGRPTPPPVPTPPPTLSGYVRRRPAPRGRFETGPRSLRPHDAVRSSAATDSTPSRRAPVPADRRGDAKGR